jgi:hypothetical protein
MLFAFKYVQRVLGKSKKLQGCPNYFLSKHYLLHLVTHEN